MTSHFLLLERWIDRIGRWLAGLARAIDPQPAFAGAPGAGLADEPGNAWSNELHNTGGPRSRTRKERLRTSVFTPGEGEQAWFDVRRVGQLWAIETAPRPARPGRAVPPRLGSLRDKALELLAASGFSSPDEAFECSGGLPRVCLSARPAAPANGDQGALRPEEDPEEFLRRALVLGKCSGCLYDPVRPVIWTEKRLGQRLELHEIGEAFYRDPA